MDAFFFAYLIHLWSHLLCESPAGGPTQGTKDAVLLSQGLLDHTCGGVVLDLSFHYEKMFFRYDYVCSVRESLINIRLFSI